MTEINEQKAIEIIQNSVFVDDVRQCEAIFAMLMEMAEWKDKKNGEITEKLRKDLSKKAERLYEKGGLVKKMRIWLHHFVINNFYHRKALLDCIAYRKDYECGYDTDRMSEMVVSEFDETFLAEEKEKNRKKKNG